MKNCVKMIAFQTQIKKQDEKKKVQAEEAEEANSSK